MKNCEVKAVCDACGGTGLYCGFCEPKGTAVVCIRCLGTGCETIVYEPFEKRRDRKGIKWVQWSRGVFIATGVGPDGEGITYKKFKQGEMPKPVKNDK